MMLCLPEFVSRLPVFGICASKALYDVSNQTETATATMW